MMTEAVISVLIIVPICVGAAILTVRAMRRGRLEVDERVEAWAKQNDLRLVSKADSFLGGPFWSVTDLLGWTTRDPVYRVVVENRDGRRRGGHVRLRSESVLNPYSSEGVDVRWDD